MLLAEVGGPIELLLGDRIYSRNGDPLEVVVGDMLRKRRATVAVAESCTGGMLGERLTVAPGSSDYFLGGFITYSNAMKIELLGVSPETLEEFGAVSAETAEAMAMGARRRTGSTYALSVTGVAGPDAGGEEAPGRHGVRGIGGRGRDARGAPPVLRRPDAGADVYGADGARSVAAKDDGVIEDDATRATARMMEWGWRIVYDKSDSWLGDPVLFDLRSEL